MVLKKIGTETVIDTTKLQSKRSNDGKGLPESQWNPEKVHILHKKQLLSDFGMKQKGLQSKHAFRPKCNFLFQLKRGLK